VRPAHSAVRPALAACGVLCAITAVTAGAVGLSGRDAALASALGFAFPRHRGSIAEAAEILSINLRTVAGLFLLTALASRWRAAGWLAWTIAASNAGVVGVALGAYGVASARWLVHLPCEWLAVALPLARRGEPAAAGLGLLGAAGLALGLLAAGAVVESFLTPV